MYQALAILKAKFHRYKRDNPKCFWLKSKGKSSCYFQMKLIVSRYFSWCKQNSRWFEQFLRFPGKVTSLRRSKPRKTLKLKLNTFKVRPSSEFRLKCKLSLAKFHLHFSRSGHTRCTSTKNNYRTTSLNFFLDRKDRLKLASALTM